jgi:hypothetical protein
MGWYWLALVIIVVLATAPMGAAQYVDYLAQANNCRLTDGGTNGPCVSPTGEDLSPLIGQLMLLAWTMLLTLPLGFILFLVWGLILIVHRILWKRAQETAS